MPAMPKNNDALAAKIRRLRAGMQLTQIQFARKLGVSQQKLSDWEHGRGLSGVINAMKLATLLQRKR